MMKKKSNEKVYALYHGDKFIDLGTKKELAERNGVTKDTINFYRSSTYKKRRKYNFDNSYVVIEVEEINEEGEYEE